MAQFNQQYQTVGNQNNADNVFIGSGGTAPEQLIESLITRLQRDARQTTVVDGVIPALESARVAARNGSYQRMHEFLARAADLAGPIAPIAVAVAEVIRAVGSA